MFLGIMEVINKASPPLKPCKHHVSMVLRDLRRALNWSPLMSSDWIDDGNFFQSGADGNSFLKATRFN